MLGFDEKNKMFVFALGNKSSSSGDLFVILDEDSSELFSRLILIKLVAVSEDDEEVLL